MFSNKNCKKHSFPTIFINNNNLRILKTKNYFIIHFNFNLLKKINK